jgi:hypothetical protein
MKWNIVLCIASIFSIAYAAMPFSGAAAQGWMQDDWSGGPNQSIFQDETGYLSSTKADTMNVPGKVRLSFLSGLYTKDPSNPVVEKGEAGEWDDSYIAGWPREKDDGTGYEMLYWGVKGLGPSQIRAIGYAESDNGIAWTKYPENPVIGRGATGQWDDGGVSTGPLIREGDTYHMFFLGYGADGKNRYGHATSTDLKTWDRGTNYVFGPGSAGEWDAVDILYFTVRRIGDLYHGWYIGRNAASIAQVGHATSVDGDTWTKDPANPVIGRGATGQWDDAGIWTLVILERMWNDDFLIAYSGSDMAFTTYGIGLATSPDGVNWTKDPANPIFTAGGSWFQSIINPYTLRYDGSIYSMYLLGVDAASFYYAGEAYSEDGSTWNMNFNNPILSPSAAPAWDDMVLFTNYPFLEDNTLRAFYLAAGTTSDLALGTATAEPSYNATGELVSSIFDSGEPTQWRRIRWEEETPAGTSITVEIRCGNTGTPGASWTGWSQVTNGGASPYSTYRYTQYRLTLSTTNPTVSPEVSRISFDMPIDLTPNKHDFTATDTISVTADVLPISVPFYPFVRIITPGDRTLYYVRGEGFTIRPASYLPGGPFVVESEIHSYPVLMVPFSGIETGEYMLQGGAVDATQTTSVGNLVYIKPVDGEMLTVR